MSNQDYLSKLAGDVLSSVANSAASNLGQTKEALEIYLGEGLHNTGLRLLGAPTSTLDACTYVYKASHLHATSAISSITFYTSKWETICNSVLAGYETLGTG